MANASGFLSCRDGGLGFQLFTERPNKGNSSSLSLDGSAWDVVVTPDEAAAKKSEKVFKDTLLFDDGRVTMTTCLEYGFTASPYSAAKLAHVCQLGPDF